MHRVFGRLSQLSVGLVFSCAAHIGLSQGIVTGSLNGSVQDPSSAVIPNAAITAVQDGTNSAFKTTSSDTGSFLLPGLPIGKYVVTAVAPGFVALRTENVLVQ